MHDLLRTAGLHTPAFVYDERELIKNCTTAQELANAAGATLLYSLKPFSLGEPIRLMSACVDGFSVSSLFEARLVREWVEEPALHAVSPLYRPEDVEELGGICEYITANSVSQWQMLRDRIALGVTFGLRVNPHVSIVDDSRYDPCRKHSKLGVPIDQLVELHDSRSKRLSGLSGLHIHNNCDSGDFLELHETVKVIEARLGSLLKELDWVNLGGGYDIVIARNPDLFIDAVGALKSRYGLDVFVEPGSGLCRSAGYIVATVRDLFVSDGKALAVLDTTVNHMPEVFEYQFEPDVIGHSEVNSHSYDLVGCTCLAGDIFGEYSFEKPLDIGSRVIFNNAGAYTLVKSNTFNGVNLPTIYAIEPSGDVVLKKEFTYLDFTRRNGAHEHAHS